MRLDNVFLLNNNKLYGCNLTIPYDMAQYVDVIEEHENVWCLKSKITPTGAYNLLGAGVDITENMEIEPNKEFYEVSYCDGKTWYRSMSPIYTLISYYLGIDYGIEEPQKITNRDYYYYYYDYVEYNCELDGKFPRISSEDIIKRVQERVGDRYDILRRVRINKN